MVVWRGCEATRVTVRGGLRPNTAGARHGDRVYTPLDGFNGDGGGRAATTWSIGRCVCVCVRTFRGAFSDSFRVGFFHYYCIPTYARTRYRRHRGINTHRTTVIPRSRSRSHGSPRRLHSGRRLQYRSAIYYIIVTVRWCEYRGTNTFHVADRMVSSPAGRINWRGNSQARNTAAHLTVEFHSVELHKLCTTQAALSNNYYWPWILQNVLTFAHSRYVNRAGTMLLFRAYSVGWSTPTHAQTCQKKSTFQVVLIGKRRWDRLRNIFSTTLGRKLSRGILRQMFEQHLFVASMQYSAV